MFQESNQLKKGKVNQRIKTFMEQRNMTVETLARCTGLDPTFLRSMQEDNVYPSLGPLLKIARALGVRLGAFLDDQASLDPLVVRKADARAELRMLRDKNRPVALKFYSLGRGKSDRHMEPFFIEVLPESAREKKLSSHEGEEFIVVVSGRIEVIYGKEVCVLSPGDSIYYNSVIPTL